MGSADNRAGSVEQAAVMVQQRAALARGIRCDMAAYRSLFLIRQGIKRRPERCRLDREQGNGGAARTAPIRTADLPVQGRFYTLAEIIDSCNYLTIIVEHVIHGPKLSTHFREIKAKVVHRSFNQNIS